MSGATVEPPRGLRCVFAYASPRVQFHAELTLPVGATALAARDLARDELDAGRGRLAAEAGESGTPDARQAALAEIPWQGGECAIFGQAASWDTVLREGDRVEILRPLLADPRISRRSRVAEARRRRQ